MEKIIGCSLSNFYRKLRREGVALRNHHWEIKTLESGHKSETACLLILVDRNHRFSLIFKLPSQTQKEIHRVFDPFEREVSPAVQQLFNKYA